MPFGLQCAPGYLSLAVQEIFNGCQDILTYYMDDILIWGRTFQECLERLEIVCERIAASGVSLKAEKCILMAKSVTFLGFVLSEEGIGICPEKTASIRKISGQSINTITAVRSFLGVTSFWRRHIKGYATIARPLTDLTKNGVDVAVESQREPAQRAIEQLKDALVSAPVLAMPNFAKEFILQTDA